MFTIEFIIERIKTICFINKIKVKELYQALNLPLNYFQRTKRGEIEFSLKVFLDIVKFLNVSFSVFFITDINYDFLKSLNKLTKEDVYLVKHIIKRLSIQ